LSTKKRGWGKGGGKGSRPLFHKKKWGSLIGEVRSHRVDALGGEHQPGGGKILLWVPNTTFYAGNINSIKFWGVKVNVKWVIRKKGRAEIERGNP